MANEGEFSVREWPGRSLEQLKEGLTTRARKALDKSEIPSLPALVNNTERQALAAKGIGRKSLAELRTALGAIGLQFGLQTVSFAGDPRRSASPHQPCEVYHASAKEGAK